MKFSPFYEKVSFVLALMVLSFGYGFASHAWEWFPKSYIEQAWRQAEQFRLRNPYLTERFYQRRGRGAIKPEDIGPGLTLLTSFWKDSTEIRLVDAHGKAVHGWPVDRGAIFPEAGLRAGDVESRSIHGAHLLPGGDVVFNVEYAGMVRLNSCGEVVWFKPSADSVKVHLSSSELGDFFTGFQGKHQRLANGNVLLTEARRGRVLEVNPDGQAVWEWIKSPLNKDRVAAVTVGTRYSITPSEVASWPCSSVSTTSTSAED
jgi:hypothetical protein